MTAETLFNPDETVKDLEAINNIEILMPFGEYVRTSESQDAFNLVLKRGFMLDSDGVLVPVDVMNKLADTYGVDYRILREINP